MGFAIAEHEKSSQVGYSEQEIRLGRAGPGYLPEQAAGRPPPPSSARGSEGRQPASPACAAWGLAPPLTNLGVYITCCRPRAAPSYVTQSGQPTHSSRRLIFIANSDGGVGQQQQKQRGEARREARWRGVV